MKEELYACIDLNVIAVAPPTEVRPSPFNIQGLILHQIQRKVSLLVSYQHIPHFPTLFQNIFFLHVSCLKDWNFLNDCVWVHCRCDNTLRQ